MDGKLVRRGQRLSKEAVARRVRGRITQAFRVVEDLVYAGLGVLLATGALFLLITGGVDLFHEMRTHALAASIPELLDRILLVLLVVELLYTVQISFRERMLLPEPFILVGLIAAIRRVLVLTAQFSEIHQPDTTALFRFSGELGVLTLLVLALVLSLILLRKSEPAAAETERAARG